MQQWWFKGTTRLFQTEGGGELVKKGFLPWVSKMVPQIKPLVLQA
jgi:hypothetical protein